VIFTWDPTRLARFWFTRDYLPEAVALDAGFATLEAILALLGAATVEPIPVPHDCRDGFFAAYWRRPEAYLDPDVRAGISGFGLGTVVGGGEPGLDAFGHDPLAFVDQRVDHLRLGHHTHDLPLHEQVALAPAGGDAEVRLPGLSRSVHDAAHHRDLQRDVAV